MRHHHSRPADFGLARGLPLALVGAAALLASPLVARAVVKDAAAHGFTVAASGTVPTSASAAYDAVVNDVGKWWNPDHTFSGNSANLSIDARPGGCFCEKMPPDGFIRHLDVVFADPGKLLRMTGGLGPLQSMAVAGTLTFSMSPDSASGTRLDMTYTAGGYNPTGFEELAPIVDFVMTEQFGRLVKHLGGSPAPSAAPSSTDGATPAPK